MLRSSFPINGDCCIPPMPQLRDAFFACTGNGVRHIEVNSGRLFAATISHHALATPDVPGDNT